MHPLSLRPGGPVYDSTGAEGTYRAGARQDKVPNPELFAFCQQRKVSASRLAR
jgi:hypothetical protein